MVLHDLDGLGTCESVHVGMVYCKHRILQLRVILQFPDSQTETLSLLGMDVSCVHFGVRVIVEFPDDRRGLLRPIGVLGKHPCR